MRVISLLLPVLLLAFPLLAGPALAQTVFTGPHSYRSTADVPPVFYVGGTATAVETFADCSLDHGITQDPSASCAPTKRVTTVTPPGCGTVSGDAIDSVDADDGSLDGLGGTGVSCVSGGSNRFVLPPGTTAAGLVYTDGPGPIYFAAFGPGDVLLGEIGPFTLDDGSIFTNVADDYFFGVKNLNGIESIRIRVGPGFSGIEVDHVQYGQAAFLSATWDDGNAIQAGGVLNPSLWVGLELTGLSPPAVTTPDADTVVLTYSGLDPNPTLQINVASYGLPFYPPDPIHVVGNQIRVVFMDGGTMTTLTIDIASSSGGLLDPLSVVGFNPQPEPPSPDLFLFDPPPTGPSEAFTIPAALTGGSGPPGATQISLTLRMLDNAMAPLPTVPIASVAPVPVFAAPALGALLLVVLAAASLIALRRRARAVVASALAALLASPAAAELIGTADPNTHFLGTSLPPGHIVLTYDDGPGANTLQIAQFLSDLGIQATFFVSGCRFIGRPKPSPSGTPNCALEPNQTLETLEYLLRMGHRVANHTQDHVHLPEVSLAEVLQQVGATQQLVDRVIVDGLYYLRPPYGQWTFAITAALNADPYLSKLTGPFYW